MRAADPVPRMRFKVITTHWQCCLLLQ